MYFGCSVFRGFRKEPHNALSVIQLITDILSQYSSIKTTKLDPTFLISRLVTLMCVEHVPLIGKIKTCG